MSLILDGIVPRIDFHYNLEYDFYCYGERRLGLQLGSSCKYVVLGCIFIVGAERIAILWAVLYSNFSSQGSIGSGYKY